MSTSDRDDLMPGHLQRAFVMKNPKSTSIVLVAVVLFYSIALLAKDAAYIPAANSPVPVGPKSGVLLLADLNGDGHLDLISQHLTLKRIDIRLGDGKGNFTLAKPGGLDLDYMPEDMASVT